MPLFTRDQLRAFAPAARADIIDALINADADLKGAGINTPLRVQHFLAQVATETGGLRSLEENLNYSAERLHAVWPNRFPTVASAQPYAHNPQKLANKVYGGRLGNKNANDGWLYRGSGALQTTGRDNFRDAGHEADPETLRMPAGAVASAIKFWTDKRLNLLADKDDVTAIRRKVNGGTNGLAEARNYVAKARKVFVSVDGDAETATPDLPPEKIRSLQEQLIKLGYVELGKADGDLGPRTIGAISAFQAENGLEVNGHFDADTQEHLWVATPRTVQRASSRPEESRIIDHAKTLQKGAVGLMGAAGLSGASDPLSAFEQANSYIARAKAILSPFHAVTDFVTQHWLIVAVVLCVAVYVYGRKIEKARISDHLTGKTA